MNIAWLLLPLTSGTALFHVFVQLLSGNPRYGWAESPLMGYTLAMAGGVCVGLGISNGWDWDDKVVALIGAILAGVLLLPAGMIGMIAFAAQVGDAAVTPGARAIRTRRSCDQAEKAARARRYEEAECLYQEALTRAIAEDGGAFSSGVGVDGRELSWSSRFLVACSRLVKQKQYVRGPEAPIRLSYGNFLSSRGRRAEAAEQWREASRGDVPEEQALMAAVRAADVYWEDSKDAATARAVLLAAANRFPKAPETKMLLKKLDSLPPPE